MVETIKKWYKYLEFPKEYDGAFYELLERRAHELKKWETPFDYPMEDDKEISLLMGLYFCEYAYEKYKERGFSEELFRETMHDIVIWTNTCVEVNGTLGLESQKWFLNNHVKLNMFRFGRLQFRPIPLQKALDAHIPVGGPLIKEECLKSFERAIEFFRKYFSEYTFDHFYCGTWLLDKTVLQFLGKNSNIEQFQSLWETYEEIPSNEGALGFILGWGCNETNMEKYPPKNRFATEIVNFVKNGGQLHIVKGRRDIK